MRRDSVGQEQDRQTRILGATAELVAKRGYNDVTVELIVERAGISYNTFYRHFSSKEECLLILIDSVFFRAQREISERLEAEPGDWPHQVATTLRALVEMIVAEPILARACIVEAPTAGPVIFERYERSIEAFVPLFKLGRGFTPRGDQLPSTIEITLAGSVLWSAYQRLIVGEVDRIVDELPEMIELVLRPYLGDEEAARIAAAEAERTAA
ncbi:MAG TPA: TetR/AcrR family transcriptional regulator [Solirubrobacterales bacterium]